MTLGSITRSTRIFLMGALFWSGAGAMAGPLMERVSTDRARYAPGQVVTISVELHNTTTVAYTGTARLAFKHLGRDAAPVLMRTIPLLLPGTRDTRTFTWTPPSKDFRGYLVEITLLKFDGSTADEETIAVDVSSDWKRFPRYGFLSRFDAGTDTNAVIRQMADYHLNGVQFYDWQWQHHRPYSPNPRWPDIANRWIDRQTVTGFIQAAHNAGMMAMNYNLLNGAYENYLQDGSGVLLRWGLFKDADGAYDLGRQDQHCCLPSSWATERLYLMDPLHTEWQDYLFAREKDVFDAFAFDGFHIDSLGGRGNLWNWDRKPVDMRQAFAPFVNAAKTSLDRRVVFNSVGTYGQDEIASSADVDFVYSELWEAPDTDSYADVVDVVDRSQARTDKAIVFAGYMNYELAKTVADGQTKPFREPAVRLANAVMFAAGAAHIELGDGGGMLSSEYFPNQKLIMSDSLRNAMRKYYDFLTAYQNLLRNGTRRKAIRVDVTGVPAHTDGRSGAVWTLTRGRPGTDIVHFINLENNVSDQWRDSDGACPYPDTFTSLPVRVYYDGSLSQTARVWVASPDDSGGRALVLPFTRGSDETGQYITFTLPRLQYWSMVWIEKSRPARDLALSETFEAVPVGEIPGDWKAISGTWAVQKPEGRTHEMQVETGGGVLTWHPGLDMGDYTVEARVSTGTTTGNAALLARVQPNGGFYQLEIKSGTTWALYKHDGAAGWREMASGPFAYSAGTYHDLRLTCRRNVLIPEIDGQAQQPVTDRDKPYYFGSIGLRSEAQLARFDNVQAHILEPTPERALRLTGGLDEALSADIAGLDGESEDARVDIRDSLRAMRQASALDVP